MKNVCWTKKIIPPSCCLFYGLCCEEVERKCHFGKCEEVAAPHNFFWQMAVKWHIITSDNGKRTESKKMVHSRCNLWQPVVFHPLCVRKLHDTHPSFFFFLASEKSYSAKWRNVYCSFSLSKWYTILAKVHKKVSVYPSLFDEGENFRCQLNSPRNCIAGIVIMCRIAQIKNVMVLHEYSLMIYSRDD